jgi:hypothetical protein
LRHDKQEPGSVAGADRHVGIDQLITMVRAAVLRSEKIPVPAELQAAACDLKRKARRGHPDGLSAHF